MGVFNRRNAAVGWLTLFVGKRVVKRKAKQANKGAVAAALAGVLGVVTFWRRRSGDEETGEES